MVPTYTNEDYARAYTEVLGMIKYFSSESVEKIPKDVMQMYEENKDENYEFEFDRNKSFDDQDISQLAKVLIANIFTDYIATEEEREYLNYRDKQELDRLEEEKRNTYNPDDIFKNRNKKENQDEIQTFEYKDLDKEIYSQQELQQQETNYEDDSNNSLIELNKQEGILKRIFNKIRSIFK